MKRDFSVVLKDYKGEVIQTDLKGKGEIKPVTLADISEQALLLGKVKERMGQEQVGADVKRKRNILAKKIYRSVQRKEPCDVSAEEITTIKELVGDIYLSDIVGAVCDELEEEKDAEAKKPEITP